MFVSASQTQPRAGSASEEPGDHEGRPPAPHAAQPHQSATNLQEQRPHDADAGLTSVSSLRATLMLLRDRKERDRRLHKEMSRTDCWKREDAESVQQTERNFTPSRVRRTVSLQACEGDRHFLLQLSRRLPRSRTALNSTRNTTDLLHLSGFYGSQREPRKERSCLELRVHVIPP